MQYLQRWLYVAYMLQREYTEVTEQPIHSPSCTDSAGGEERKEEY